MKGLRKIAKEITINSSEFAHFINTCEIYGYLHSIAGVEKIQ